MIRPRLKPPYLKSKRPPRRQIVTMVVGFECRDGIVIAADRQVTGANYTFPECKLASLYWKNGHGIFGYSGDRDIYHDFLKEIHARIKPDTVLSSEAVRANLRDTLKALALKREAFLTLFGFGLDNKPFQLLLSTTKMRVVDVRGCEVIGYADSPLARFLLGRLKGVPHFISVNQARIYAVYFISQVKKYDGKYVGDGIDVYSVDHSGDAGRRCVRILDAGQTGAWEKEVNLIHYWMDVLFSKATDKDSAVSLEQFMERLKSFRIWVGGEPLK